MDDMRTMAADFTLADNASQANASASVFTA
jgi:hypothetical protein